MEFSIHSDCNWPTHFLRHTNVLKSLDTGDITWLKWKFTVLFCRVISNHGANVVFPYHSNCSINRVNCREEYKPEPSKGQWIFSEHIAPLCRNELIALNETVYQGATNTRVDYNVMAFMGKCDIIVFSFNQMNYIQLIIVLDLWLGIIKRRLEPIQSLWRSK